MRHRFAFPGLLLLLTLACGGRKTPLIGTGTSTGGATTSSQTTGGIATGGTGTGAGATTTGGTTGSTSTTGGCGAGQCPLLNGTCGWNFPGAGPCNSPGTPYNLACCPGLACSDTNVCGLPAGALCGAGLQCKSGICGINGTGRCCSAACSTASPACGASGCDEMGACLYAPTLTPCGSPRSCTGHEETEATTCDGLGNCRTPVSKDCAPFSCGDAGVCLTRCTGDGDCVAGQSCDVASASCCSPVADDDTLQVDALIGSDATACCGLSQYGPCQTVARAMALIDVARAHDVKIVAAVDGGGGDWSPVGEVYPIVLGWGVELIAAGVYFFDPASVLTGRPSSSIFDVNFYSAADTVGYASLVGAPMNPVGAGMNANGSIQSGDPTSIAVETGNTLYVANANVNAAGGLYAIEVHGGATLSLGADQSYISDMLNVLAVTGTVQIGNASGDLASAGYIGLECRNEYIHAVLTACTIKDAILPAGQSSVIIQGQRGRDIDTMANGDITLTSNPVFGVPPTSAGFGNCPSKLDAQYGGAALLIWGSANLTLKNATLQCIGGTALLVAADFPTPPPNATLDNVLIQNADIGIYASAGTVNVTNSTLRYNVVGVQQDYEPLNDVNGAINLADGGNTVICSDYSEKSVFDGGPPPNDGGPGIDVWNTSKTSLNASNVAWDTAGPDYFQCDRAFTACTCNLTVCTIDAGANDMDAVEDSTNLGGIVTTGQTQSPNGCR